MKMFVEFDVNDLSNEQLKELIELCTITFLDRAKANTKSQPSETIKEEARAPKKKDKKKAYKWTDEDVSKLEDFVNQGKTYKEMAKEFGMSVDQVKGKCRFLGLRVKTQWEKNREVDETEEMVKVKRFVPHDNGRWKEKKILLIKKSEMLEGDKII